MKIPGRLPRIATTHRYSYPFLYHYLLALFPDSGRRWFERCTGALFDTVNGLLAYWFCLWLIESSNAFQNTGSIPIWVTTLFVFSPALLRLGSGPRAYNGSPRVMGQTLYLVHILGAFFAYSTGDIFALLLSIASGAAVMVTAKFSNQVILWFGLFFSVAISWLYLPVIIASLLVAQICSNGRASWVIQGQINHSRYYYKYLQQVFIYPNVRSADKYIAKAKDVFNGLVTKAEVTRIVYWFYTEPYMWHLFLTVYPYFLLALASGMFGWGALETRFLFVWSLAGFAGFLLTKFPSLGLMFLGEGERYLEYALLPSILLGVNFLMPTYEIFLYGWLIYCLLSALIFLAQYIIKNDEEAYAETEALFVQLNQLPLGPILPIGSFQWQALFRSNFPVVTYGTNIEEQYIPVEEHRLLFSNYPFPSGDLKKVIEHFSIDYILTDKPKLDLYKGEVLDQEQDFENMTELLCSSDTLQVYRVHR